MAVSLADAGKYIDDTFAAVVGEEYAPLVALLCVAFVVLAGLTWIGTIAQYTSIEFYSFCCFRPRNMSKVYGGDEEQTWAVVSGGSSGIGLAVVKRLAADGLNVVVVALGDSLLDKSVSELRKEFPKVQFRGIGADLSKPPAEYMPAVEAGTEDILPRVVFLNAGFMKTGFFDATPLGLHLAISNCNATAAMAMASHFIGRLKNEGSPDGNPLSTKGKRGCVVFTSSPAGFMPAPFSCMYGATKAYLTEFATSIAPECAPIGIDVSVVHPSPVASRFYDQVKHSIDLLEMFKATGTTPDTLARVMLAGVGRRVVIEQGYYPASVRLFLKVLDPVFFAELMASISSYLPDYARMREAEAKKLAEGGAGAQSKSKSKSKGKGRGRAGSRSSQ